MANIALAEKKMNKILMQWHINDQLLLWAWCLVEKRPSKNQDTIGIDTRCSPPIINFNPNFINSLSVEQLECVMVSEALKLLLKHPTSRLQKPKNISALSSTLVVDQMIMGKIDGLDLEEIPLPKMFDLPIDSYFEDYFRRLLEKSDKTNEQINEYWNSLSNEEKKELIENAMQEENDQQTDEDGYPIPSENPMKDYTDPNGSATQDWQPNELFDNDVKNMVDKLKGSGKSWGKYTSSQMESIIAANTPKISWKEVLRRFNNSVISTVSSSSRMKVNRRYDLNSPGYRREFKANVVFAIDQSGSISDDDLSEAFAVVNSTLKHAKIEVVLFDTQINTILPNIKTAKKMYQRTANGGTDFKDVMVYAEKQKVDGLIVFTDGYASAPPKPKNVRVLWLLDQKGNQPPVEWGYRAHLNRYE